MESNTHNTQTQYLKKVCTGTEWRGKQVVSPPCTCLAEMIITQQFLGHEEDSDRPWVTGAHLLYEDHFSLFSQLRANLNYEIKCLFIFNQAEIGATGFTVVFARFCDFKLGGIHCKCQAVKGQWEHTTKLCFSVGVSFYVVQMLVKECRQGNCCFKLLIHLNYLEFRMCICSTRKIINNNKSFSVYTS